MIGQNQKELIAIEIEIVYNCVYACSKFNKTNDNMGIDKCDGRTITTMNGKKKTRKKRWVCVCAVHCCASLDCYEAVVNPLNQLSKQTVDAKTVYIYTAVFRCTQKTIATRETGTSCIDSEKR